MEGRSDSSRTARRWLIRILEALGLPARIECHERDGYLVLNAVCEAGAPRAWAIGQRGQTLEAIQLLVRRIVERLHSAEEASRILVDIEDYRLRRRRNLLHLVRRTAELVRESGQGASITPLNSYERFLVHQAVRAERGVVSRSLGEGPRKSILISPEENG